MESAEKVVCGCCLIMLDLDMPFAGHATDLEYIDTTREILCDDILSEYHSQLVSILLALAVE